MEKNPMQLLLIVERVVVIAAACFAMFPLYQYWAEADDRARERAVREAQLATLCVQMRRHLRASIVEPDQNTDKIKVETVVSSEVPPWVLVSIIDQCKKLGTFD